MTNQKTATQSAEQDPLSDEYVNAVIQQHGYDSPECVIARLHQWIGLHGGENGVTLLMYEAHKALVKLRAPVAGDTDALSLEAQEHGHRRYEQGFAAGWNQCAASAPVAGEAQPTDAEIIDLAVEPLGIDCDRMPHGVVVFARNLLSRYAAPQASEAVRIQFPAHLRKMWSGGEVQAWLDEHQGVTPPKVSAKGSLERYRKWQAEREEAFGAGVKAAADLVKKTVEDYDANHGSTDCETGTREYPGEGATWVCEMQELEESIRALSAQAGAQRTGGCDAA